MKDNFTNVWIKYDGSKKFWDGGTFGYGSAVHLQGLAYIFFQLICLFIGSLQRYDMNGVVEVQGVTSIEDVANNCQS